MILNVVPVNDANKDCLEKLIETLAVYFNRPYELMYLNSLSFKFESLKDGTNSSIGSRMHVGSKDKFNLLKNNHGIQFTIFSKVVHNEINSILEKQISDGYPVIIEMDSFWLPWNGFYQKKHFSHYLIIVGIDHTTNEYICTDPRITATPQLRLAFDHFKKGYKNIGTILLSTNVNLKLDDYLSLLSKQLSKHLRSRPYDHMRKFASEINELRNIDEEIKESVGSSLELSPLYNNLDLLAKGRLNYSLLLRLINKHSGGGLTELSDQMLEIGQAWKTVRGIWSKMYLKRNVDEQVLNKISIKIIDLAIQEENLINELRNIIELNDTKFTLIENIILPVEKHLDNIKSKCVNIDDYVNNYGFGGLNDEADFDGNQLFIVKEGHKNNEVLICGGNQFQLTKVDSNNYDNISCYGQIIELEPDQYIGFRILGCSDHSTFFDKLIAEFSNGSREEIRFSLTDWFSHQPEQENEIIMWEGNLAQRTSNGTELFKNNVRLFSRTFLIRTVSEKMTKLHLPLCPNIHVFGLTMLQLSLE